MDRNSLYFQKEEQHLVTEVVFFVGVEEGYKRETVNSIFPKFVKSCSFIGFYAWNTLTCFGTYGKELEIKCNGFHPSLVLIVEVVTIVKYIEQYLSEYCSQETFYWPNSDRNE